MPQGLCILRIEAHWDRIIHEYDLRRRFFSWEWITMAEQAESPDEREKYGGVRFTERDAQAAQEALTHRPRISIRLRIVSGFFVTFALTCSIVIASVLFISNITEKQSLLEKAGNIEFEIQQARRFEKNWFLYGTNLYDALENVHNAENQLNETQEEMRETIGERSFENLSRSLIRYRKTLEKLGAVAQPPDSLESAQRLALESELRQFGAEIVAQASNVVEQERLGIHSWLKASMAMAIAALVVVLMFVAFIAAFITRQIIRPFQRFEMYTRRIAAGDFSLITPARGYRDEFTDLAIALNHMLLELKRHQEQLIQSRKMAAIGDLTAGIAHELNNPLNNISLTTEALIDEFDECSDEEKLKMLRTIFTQVERAGATVSNLLDFTRRDETSFEEISINDVLNRTITLVANEISLNGIDLTLDLGTNLPAVRGNVHNLQQVFLNLFLNAIQAMPDKGTLTVRSFVEDGLIRVDVSDTGIGIPPENLSKIFDPFFTTKEVGRGTGLGLTVSYGIIKKHSGDITVTSIVGKGSNFSVILPISSGTPWPENAAVD